MSRSKAGPGILLVLLLIPVGLLTGGIYAVVTPEDAGLAAGAIALFKILIGGVLAVITGIVLALVLPREALRRVTVAAGILCAAAVLLIAFRIWSVREQRLERAAQETAEAEERRAALRAEAFARGMPPEDSLAPPPSPPAGVEVADPPGSDAWRESVHLSVGLPMTAPAPDVAFYHPAPNGPMALARDAAYWHAMMPAGRQTGPCGDTHIPGLFGAASRLDLGSLTSEHIEAIVDERCATELTAHGAGYARATSLRNVQVSVDVQAERLCGGEEASYVIWAQVDALPGNPILLTTLPRSDGPNDFEPADALRTEWPASLHRGQFRLPEGSRVSSYTAWRYSVGGAPSWLVEVRGATPGGDEYPPVEVAYQAWYFVRDNAITPLVDNDPGGRCGPQEIRLAGTLDLTGDGDRDLVFGPSLLVLERDGDGFRTRAAARMPCVC